ncbi:MAG: TIGR00725 family protein [Cyanobacteria bacterium P01_F01_bin.42]
MVPQSVPQPLIGIIGAGSCSPEIDQLAYEVGVQLARSDYAVICGGRDGVMAAVCRGAKQAQGTTVGILSGTNADAANPWVDIVIPTGMGDARNLIIVHSAIALIAISGEYGTLSEIAFALKLNKPLVGLQTWQPVRPGLRAPEFPLVQTASDAVEWIQHAVAEDSR